MNGVFVKDVTTLTGLTFAAGETKPHNNILFNTGAILAGAYRTHLVLIDNGKQVGEAFAPFTIATPTGNLAVTSKVVTDKMSYNANEQTAITSTVQSASANAILYNLTARITLTGADGAAVFTETKTIPILGPGARVDLTSYWNTGTSLKGPYTVALEVLDGTTLLSTSQAVFTIAGSSGTAAGVTGTISATPNPVYQGFAETITYTVKNTGNEGLADLIVKVLIVNPDTQGVMNTFQATVTVPPGGSSSGNVAVPTASLTPHIYLAVLQIGSATITQPKTIANVAFEVKAGIEITKKIADNASILVWINDKCYRHGDDDHHVECHGSHPDCIRLDLLEKILKEAAVNYHIVYDGQDFEVQMRNPFYTDFMILGDQESLTDHHGEELQEQVNSGKGLISSLYMKHGECFQGDSGPLFGLSFFGALPGDNHHVEILKGPLSDTTSLEAKGSAIRVECDRPDDIMAWIGWRSGYNCHNIPREYPGIIAHQYGKGKTLFFAFDVGKTLSDGNYATISTILKNAISYVHTSAASTTFYPGQFVPIAITLKSLSASANLRITETYPQDIKLYDPAAGQWVTTTPWIFNVHLNAGETRTIIYYAFTPDKTGLYTMKSDVDYVDNGTYRPYKSLSADVFVEKDMATLTNDIIAALNALSVTSHDRAKVHNAIERIKRVQRRIVNLRSDMGENIFDILKAIESLLDVRNADITQIRLIMDELLKVWEGRYYLRER